MNKVKNLLVGGRGWMFSNADPWTPVKSIASFWYNKRRKVVWYSDNQDGYYFTNGTSNWIGSVAHTHIYNVVWKKEEGVYEYSYTTKKSDGKHVEKNKTFTAKSLSAAANKIEALNKGVGADGQGAFGKRGKGSLKSKNNKSKKKKKRSKTKKGSKKKQKAGK